MRNSLQAQAPSPLVFNDEEEDKGGKRETKNTQTVGAVLQNDLIFEKTRGVFYLRKEGEQLYELLDEYALNELVWKTWYGLHGSFLPKDINAAIETMKMVAPKKVDIISKRFLMVTEHIFWDKEKGTLVEKPSDAVFYKLFNTPIETKHIVKIPEFTEEQEARLWETFEIVKGELERGEEVERFKPLQVWADESHDIYMDLHRAHAYCLLNELPVGAYLLIGGAAGGKSTYAGMTHTIFGNDNTSAVTLADMGDWHANHDLAYTLMNCPDEDEDKALSSQAIFKTVADHGVVELNTMASHDRLRVNCDFMCFFPMNHLPKWEGSGASACMRRSLVIPFNANLKKYDNGTNNFARETFTADFMCEYMGSVFAYAYYYHRHNPVFSKTMLDYQTQLTEEVSNYELYIPKFLKYFSGYTSRRKVFEDYLYWCDANEMKCAKRDTFLFHLDRKIPATPATKTVDGRRQRFYGDESKHIFSDLWAPADDKRIDRVEIQHGHEASMVEILETMYQPKWGE